MRKLITCCFTGHRKLPADKIERITKRLDAEIDNLIRTVTAAAQVYRERAYGGADSILFYGVDKDKHRPDRYSDE